MLVLVTFHSQAIEVYIKKKNWMHQGHIRNSQTVKWYGHRSPQEKQRREQKGGVHASWIEEIVFADSVVSLKSLYYNSRWCVVEAMQTAVVFAPSWSEHSLSILPSRTRNTPETLHQLLENHQRDGSHNRSPSAAIASLRIRSMESSTRRPCNTTIAAESRTWAVDQANGFFCLWYIYLPLALCFVEEQLSPAASAHCISISFCEGPLMIRVFWWYTYFFHGHKRLLVA